VLLPVDVIVEHGDRTVAFVGQRDSAGLTERHRPIAVAGASEGSIANHHRVDVAVVSMTDAEEVAERRVDAGSLLAVVIDAKARQSRPGVFVIRHGEPDVADDAGSLQVCHDERFARHDALGIVVGIDEPVAARDAMSGEVFHPGETGERILCQAAAAGSSDGKQTDEGVTYEHGSRELYTS
jgi:hypothetical protein